MDLPGQCARPVGILTDAEPRGVLQTPRTRRGTLRGAGLTGIEDESGANWAITATALKEH